MGIDKKYYVNVREVMLKAYLPRPRRKHKISVIVSDGEWLPIIDGSTGKVVMV
jgi:hypothetical protein